jgi:transposase
MRGEDRRQGAMFSYVSLEQRVPEDHPLRKLLPMVNEALAELSPRFESLYSRVGRTSIAPEKLLRALLLQVLYLIRSERMLIEQLDYNLLFRWFVGLGMDDPVWVPTVFTKNRDRLLEGEVPREFEPVGLGKLRTRRGIESRAALPAPRRRSRTTPRCSRTPSKLAPQVDGLDLG